MADGRPADDTVAETGGGIPDDAVAEGELAPGEIGAGAEQAVEALERSGWTQGRTAEEVEPETITEGQPS